MPRDWISSFGEIAKFSGRVTATVFNGRILPYSGEVLRQAGLLIFWAFQNPPDLLFRAPGPDFVRADCWQSW